MSKVLSALCLGAALTVSSAAMASEKSPIFGSAKADVTSKVENKGIVGKGYYADYYGAAGLNDAYNAYIYGYYGYYGYGSSYYFAASDAAYSAYVNFYYAGVYDYYGY